MDRNLIDDAISAIDLLDIFLYSSSTERYGEISESNAPDNMKQQNSLEIEADFMAEEDSQGNENHGLIRARVRLGARMVIGKEGGEVETLSEIEACFAAIYLKKAEVSEKAIEEFMKFNVIHNVWPFWREHAYRVSREARLPTPMVPLFSGNLIQETDN